MPKLPRITVVQFGASGPSTDFGQFGSKTAAAPQTSQNPSVIMQLGAWATGWATAAVGAAFNPYLEDMNGFCLTAFYFLANIFERGIPDWSSTTTYFKGAYVQDPAGTGQRWYSLTDNNLGNAPPAGASNAQWQWDNPVTVLDGGVTVNAIPKVSAAGPGQLVDSAWSDDGVNVATSLPIKFPDNSVQTVAADPVSAQNVVTGSRAYATTYQNTSGKPLFVGISFDITGGGNTITAFADAALNPATQVAKVGSSGGLGTHDNLFFIVLPGNYYKVTQTNASPIASWVEWQ